jgi:DMSO/TMAO reductase YedYZ molybdopterin-dependent catalytic subunit
MKVFPRDSTLLAAESWNHSFRLTVAGLVSRTLQFSLPDLRLNFGERSFDCSLGDRFSVGEKSWLGCSLNELLEFAGVSGQARHIEFVGSPSEPDGVRSFSVPVTDLEHEEIGLVWERDGESLSAEHGGPLLALLPTLEGYRTLAGVTRINLVIIPCSTSRGGTTPALAA